MVTGVRVLFRVRRDAHDIFYTKPRVRTAVQRTDRKEDRKIEFDVCRLDFRLRLGPAPLRCGVPAYKLDWRINMDGGAAMLRRFRIGMNAALRRACASNSSAAAARRRKRLATRASDREDDRLGRRREACHSQSGAHALVDGELDGGHRRRHHEARTEPRVGAAEAKAVQVFGLRGACTHAQGEIRPPLSSPPLGHISLDRRDVGRCEEMWGDVGRCGEM